MTPPPRHSDEERTEVRQKEQMAQALARLLLGAWRSATAEPLKTLQALGLASLVLMVGWEKAAKQLGLEIAAGTPPAATISRDEVRAIANEAATAAADKAVASLSRRIDAILLLRAAGDRGGALASMPPLPRAYYQSETTAAAP